MIMRKIQYILGGLVLLAFPLETQAQKQSKDSTVNRTVVVEQEYNPDIMDASKINVLPQVEPPTVSKKIVEYDITLIPPGQIPTTVMQVYTGKEVQAKVLPGYIRMGYGSKGNLDMRANYLFTFSDRNRLNLTLHMNGMDGKLELPDNLGKWNAYYYHTYAGIDYTHTFKKVDMNTAGNFDLSNFNFLPGSVNNKQKFTAGSLHFGVKSTGDELPVQFRAETNLLLYGRQHELSYMDTKESIVRTLAEASAPISEEQFIGVAFAMDNAFYKNNLFEDYTSLNLTPYYLFKNDDWKIRLGVHVDFSFGFGKKFYASPDVMVQYTFSDSYQLYAQAKGGKQLNDFRRMETISPYGQTMVQPEATYEQLNAALGFKASPVTGLWLNFYGGYQNLKNDLLQMQFSIYNNSEDYPHALLLGTANTHNIYTGAEVSYDYKNLISFSASGIYRNWSINYEDINKGGLLFKPSLETKFEINFQPISVTSINFGYQYINREKMEERKVNSVSNLYLGGNYEFFKGISVYIRINNLLNKNYQYYWGYPTEGINFLGGVNFKF